MKLEKGKKGKVFEIFKDHTCRENATTFSPHIGTLTLILFEEIGIFWLGDGKIEFDIPNLT